MSNIIYTVAALWSSQTTPGYHGLISDLGTLILVQCYRAREQNIFIFIFKQNFCPQSWYFKNKNAFQPKFFSSLFPYITMDKLYKCSSLFQQNHGCKFWLNSTANILRMQAPPDFSFGIIAYHCNLYITHKCGLL